MGELSKKLACDAFEEVNKAAKEAWERFKKAYKKGDKVAADEAIEDFVELMDLLYEVWPSIINELRIDTTNSATKTAYLGGFAEATDGYKLSEEIGVKRGDYVATSTLYKVYRIFPQK